MLAGPSPSAKKRQPELSSSLLILMRAVASLPAILYLRTYWATDKSKEWLNNIYFKFYNFSQIKPHSSAAYTRELRRADGKNQGHKPAGAKNKAATRMITTHYVRTQKT
jgi:hypothetical protein